MTGFTPVPLQIVLRILPEDLRVQRLAEMFVFLAVALDSPRLADVLRRLRSLRRLRGGFHRRRLYPAHHQRRDA